MRFFRSRTAATLAVAAAVATGGVAGAQRAPAKPADPAAPVVVTPAAYAALPWRHIGPEGNRFSTAAGIAGDPSTYYVGAASGGIYKTTDSGRSWRLVLKGDEDTGANDIVMSKGDPNVLFASLYQRRRTSCCMNGGGPGSGVYKSTDGGASWASACGSATRTALTMNGAVTMKITKRTRTTSTRGITLISAINRR